MTEPIYTPVKPPFWNNPQTRAIAFQVIALVVTVAFGLYIFENTQANHSGRREPLSLVVVSIQSNV